MKKRFLKILITFTLTFSIFFSFNFFNFNNKNFIYKSNNIVYAATNNKINSYCFSIKNINTLKIIDTNLNMNNYSLRQDKISEIIIHHSAGENTTVEDIDRMHRENGWGGIGYNFYIRKNGTIYKGRDLKYSGAHCIGKNENSIGICLEGNFNHYEPSNEQMGSLLALTTGLSKNYNITALSPHREFNATECPGRYFPWDMFEEVYNNIIKSN